MPTFGGQPRSRTAATNRRWARQPRRGQALVEFALVASVLLLLIAAIFDLGNLVSDHLAVTQAARQAALLAAAAGTDPAADCGALLAIAAATQGQTGLSVTRIVVYEAGNDGLPVGGAGSTADANVYSGDPGCAPGTTPAAATANWPPASRNACPYSGNALGVEIDYTYSWQTAMIAVAPLALTDRAVIPLAPNPALNC